jgi:hypothetical protein
LRLTELISNMKTMRKTTKQTQCCRICKLDLPLESFHIDNRQPSNRYDMCRSCRAHHRRIARLSKAEYEALLQAQNNACAICLRSVEETNRSLHVDHDHTTNLVRGLLCAKCNLGLGYFKDNINNLDSAKSYLTKDVK